MKEVILGITGSIAAYKAADIANELTKSQISVHTIMTRAGAKFITPLTLQTLTKNRVYTDLFEDVFYEDVRHISLAKRADVCVIAPATANIIGKIASGIADDMLTTVVMAMAGKPILICPAMNTAMYEHPATCSNMENLRAIGIQFVEPKASLLACGDLGKGALADVAVIVAAVKEILNMAASAFTSTNARE
jgi:phosphopantothenoylcysteine decarboxylase/phosphopantothenoylcysteine decarboxylase/phosphopantothenate--cysteine ligase